MKIVVVDDNPFVTGGLKIILEAEPDFTVEACLENGQEAVTYCAEHPVDLVLMDVRMPILDGLTATQQIVAQAQPPKVLILTTFDEDQEIQQGIQNGASGYLIKNTPPEHLIQAIRTVLQGNHVLSNEVFQKSRQQSVTRLGDLSDLTKREGEVAHLVAKGYSNKEIAKRLFISEGTVHNALSVILHKLDLDHRTQLAIYVLTGRVGD